MLKDAHGHALISPLGRLPRPVLSWLCTYFGWKEISLDDPTIPLFAFANKNCGDFSSAGVPISQLQQENYCHVDDKVTLTQHVCRAEMARNVMPLSFESKDVAALIEKGDFCCSDSVWFVKHRLGVKGKAVHIFKGLSEAQKWLDAHPGIAQDFVVQREVTPWLIDGRKFVIRVHALLTTLPEKVYVHEQCICIVHEEEYVPFSTDNNMQISSAQKPRKVFLLAEDRELHDTVFSQLLSSVNQVHHLVRCQILPRASENGGSYHLFGYDFAVNSTGQAKLLEINAFPAIGTGTMAAVPAQLFTDLLQDVIKVVVLPVMSNGTILPHRFIQAFPKTQRDESNTPANIVQ